MMIAYSVGGHWVHTWIPMWSLASLSALAWPGMLLLPLSVIRIFKRFCSRTLHSPKEYIVIIWKAHQDPMHMCGNFRDPLEDGKDNRRSDAHVHMCVCAQVWGTMMIYQS